MRICVLVLLALVATACSMNIDITSRVHDLDNITHDLEYSWRFGLPSLEGNGDSRHHIPRKLTEPPWSGAISTSKLAERGKSGVPDLGMINSVHCKREQNDETTATCTGLPDSLFAQSGVAAETAAGELPEGDEAAVADLEMFDSVYCTKEEGDEITITCVDLPHALLAQSAAAGEGTSIEIDIDRKDLGSKWRYYVVMVNPFVDWGADLLGGDLTWVVNLPGVIVESNADSVSEDEGRAEFASDLEDPRDRFFAVSEQTKTGTPSSRLMCDSGIAVPDPANNPGLVKDCETLLAARDGLSRTLNWLPETPISQWDGVTTSGSPTRVAGLYLYNRELNGEIPLQIGSLSELEALWLHDNQLTGDIPQTLGNLSNLNQLSLTRNRLSGELPAELGRLSGLKYLSLGDNDLTGSVPGELGNLPDLQQLWLYGNDLTGEIPAELGNLSDLQQLWLYGNDLTGEIPAELGSLSNLKHLSLGNNRLTGSVPSELGNLSDLQQLWLYGNDLTGEIPAELGSLSNLKHLSLSNNSLTGSIPSELGNLSDLQQLWLYENDLTGEIPAELGSLSRLTHLSLSNNSLTGSIPSELGNLSDLQQLWLYENDLTGEIPAELGSLSRLTHLSLSNNSLTGSIPSELGNLSDLQQLWLYENDLTGPVPAELGRLSNLETLYLCGNRITGTLPVEFGDLSWIDTDGCVPPGTVAPTVTPSPTVAQQQRLPTNVVAANGAHAGTVELSWDPVPDLPFYRIGWFVVPNVEAVTEAGRPWEDAFVTVAIANTGQDSHTITHLVPGVQYWFIIGVAEDRYAEPVAWSEWTEPLTVVKMVDFS